MNEYKCMCVCVCVCVCVCGSWMIREQIEDKRSFIKTQGSKIRQEIVHWIKK